MGSGDVGPFLACGWTIKFHFCRANVFELAIKQRFSPPSQRTTRPCRAAPRRWPLLVFCLLTNELVLRYTPSVLLFVFVALLHGVLSRRLKEAQSYFGVRKYTRPVVCEGCQRAAVAGGTCNIIDKSQRGTKSRVYPVLSIVGERNVSNFAPKAKKNLWTLFKDSRRSYYSVIRFFKRPVDFLSLPAGGSVRSISYNIAKRRPSRTPPTPQMIIVPVGITCARGKSN